ncbi:MAG: hypothetical protein K0U98_25285 [Deltaproteobacteria bacterium]|nr:hypothetical protein [Deltaproteobacteria bacterium]
MLSTCMDIRSKERSRLKRKLTLWLVCALTLVTTVAWSAPGPSPSGGPASSDGPWRAVANVQECSSLGRVCAEWPFQINGQNFLAVCCILPIDLGTTKPPDHACAPGGLVVVRRGDDAGESSEQGD